jgi:hypothetical protein
MNAKSREENVCLVENVLLDALLVVIAPPTQGITKACGH